MKDQNQFKFFSRIFMMSLWISLFCIVNEICLSLDCNSTVTITSGAGQSGCIYQEYGSWISFFTLDINGNTTIYNVCTGYYNICVENSNGNLHGTRYDVPIDGEHNYLFYVNNNNTCYCLGRTNINDLNDKNISNIDIPSIFSLEQNYPNPFNPTTTISFSIPKASMVELIVYDVLGREVQILTKDLYQEGKYSINFNASNLESGLYFYKITANDFIETKKMMLIK